VTSRAAPTNVISNQLAFGYSVALKENRDTLFVLRHHRGLPTTSASLVEQVGESIFVFSCVSRQLHHHSLVFFHQELEIKCR
jgi:tRNA pseudouridine-54 N-methylase